MADINNLSNFLTDVASAIREKKGSTALIPAASFDEEILNLPSSSSSGEVKLFATKEEMRADTTAQEGDLAVVYKNEIQNATVDSRFQTATFPETVTLDTAITDYIEVRYRAVDSSIMFDCWGSLDSSRFDMSCYTESGEIRIQYTSEDGMTYTRIDSTGNPVDFGTEIYYEIAEYWNDAIGKFILTGLSSFDGLYKYDGSAYVIADTQLTAIASNVYKSNFYGKNGVEQGVLTIGISNSFADINAEVYSVIQNVYNEMEPRVLTDTDKTIDEKIYFIPTNKNNEPLLDTSNVTNMNSMFEYCTNLTSIPQLDTSNVIHMNGTFRHCSSLTSIPMLDTSNVTEMNSTFAGCSNLTEIPMLDTSNVTSMSDTFASCSNLTTIPLLNTSKVTDIQGMFDYCTSLTTIPQLDTSNVTNMYRTFAFCSSLTEIPMLDTSNVTEMGVAFRDCSSLTSIPQLDTSNVTSMDNTFSYCTSLVDVPVLNLAGINQFLGFNFTFNNCPALSDTSLNNIMESVSKATAYTGTKTLRWIGLSQDQATRCQFLSNYSAFTAAGWTTGY